MGKLKKWFTSMSGQEKTMLIFIILLVIAIITRWGYIKTEASGALKDRFNRIYQEQAADDQP